jgi:hypothetical protein
MLGALIVRKIMASKKDESKAEGNIATSTNAKSTFDSGNYPPPLQQQQFQREEEHNQVNRSIDETKANVKRSIEEARREIPAYTQSVTDYQQQAMDSAQEITDNYLNSQKEIINTIQSTWSNYLDTVFWWLSPRRLSEIYAQSVSSFADNAFSGTRIWNKTILANVDASKAYLGRTREASRDISRINTNMARTFERTTSQISPGPQQQLPSERYSEAR